MGLEQISKEYQPLFPEIYSNSITPHNLTEILQQAINSGDYSKIFSEPVKEYGVYLVPLFSPSFCQKIFEEIEHYEKMASIKSLPLFIRHDGNIGFLENCGFNPFFESILKILTPILQLIYSDLGKISCRHGFMTRNYLGREIHLKKHRDKSDITINICLTKEDTVGSTVSFFSKYDGIEPPEIHKKVLEYCHSIGVAVIHTGKHWHKTDPIFQGKRSSLIMWIDK